jgi:hypothetical protein
VREGIVEEGIRCEEVLDLLDWPACAVEVGLADAQPIVWKKSA